MQIAHHEGRERAVGIQVGAQQDTAWLEARDPQDLLEESRRHAKRGNRLANRGQHRGQALEGFCIGRHREMTCPSPRSHA